ncbi:MAG: competence damage-inducible protein A [Nitrososphaerota archaeon]|nr:competence damage-inducible protein A [Nitrososphaerota archaeon]
MVRIELLAVGRELLIGRTLNTNAHWMGRRLALMGSMIKQITTIDDDLREISSSLRGCLSREPRILVVMGGLGPTPDDMTLKGVAAGLGRGMKLNSAALEMVREHYARRGMSDAEMTPARRKMATLPARSQPLPNGLGTAPGVRIEVGGTVIFCLPGVPSEMKALFRRSVEPEIRKELGTLYRGAFRFKVEGIRESALAPIIARELRRYPGTYVKSHPRGTKGGVSRIELDIVAVSKDRADADRVAGAVARESTSEIRKVGGKVLPAGEARA